MLKGVAMTRLVVRLSILSRWGSLLILLNLLGPVAVADLLTPADEVVEALMQAQGQDLTALVRFFGNDGNAVLHFTSAVDVNARTFSFLLIPGSTYLGMPFSMSTTGSGNATDAWTWTTTSSLGTVTWTTTASGQFVDPPSYFDIFVDIDLTKDQHSFVTYEQTAGRTVSVETTTFTSHDLITNVDTVYKTTQRFDEHVLQGPDAGKWIWGDVTADQVDGHTLNIQSGGFSPLDGGAGSFTATFVPEPSTLMLTVTALAFLVPVGFRKVQNRRSEAALHRI
jgi:hypothetical protein